MSKHALTLLFLLCGCESHSDQFRVGGYRYDTRDFNQWKLPGSLREISGLAETVDGRLFAHGDERAVVYQLDYQTGKRLKSFALGHRPGASKSKGIKGDFEGIAVAGDDLYLVTSQGTLYAAQIGVDDSTVGFEVHGTGLADTCEIEGLTYHPDLNVLLLACKTIHGKYLRGRIAIFQWSIEHESIVPDATITVSMADVAARLPGSGKLHPSGITVSPRNGNLVLVAARQRALLELTLRGEIINVFTLPMESYHRQAEGIALFADGTLILADEGGNKRGRLGVYRATE